MKKTKAIRLINSANPTSRNQKYSNKTLFNRREKERELISNLKDQKTTTSNFYNYKKSLPEVINNVNKLKQNNSIYSKTTKITNSDFSFIPNTFYLTQNQNFSDLIINNNNDFSSFNLSEYGTKKKPFIGNIKLLNHFEEKTKSLEQVKKNKRKIDKKINQLNIRKSGLNDYIKKTKEVLLMNYTYNIKKERFIRLNENYENQKKTLDEIIKSLNISQKLFHEQFYNKFGDYIKQLSIKRENEKLINSNLLEKELKLKGEISQINSKIQKMTIDKNNIIRWIYFQISVKEKILNIPIHYQYIIEDQDDSFKLTDKNYKRGETIKNNVEDKFHHVYRKNSVKRQSNKNLAARRFTKFLQKIENNNHSFINISNNEIERIKLYKDKPPFSSPNEFMDVIKKYEMENNNNLNLYNDLRLELRYLKKEKKELEKEKNNEINQVNEVISKKINELNNIKDRFEILIKEKNNLIKFMNENKNKFNKEKKRKTIFDFENNKIYHYKPNLEERIKTVFKTCQEINLDKIISPDIFNKRKNNTKEEELIEFLSKIELVLSFLIGKLSVYRKNNIYFDELKKIQNEIEKENKIIKNKKQREQEILKIKKLKELIEERNQKNYFIPKKKVNNYFEFVKKKTKKISFQNNYFKEPNFEDFMYDIEKKRSVSQ
jgi:AraC-like DNA-binding protein